MTKRVLCVAIASAVFALSGCSTSQIDESAAKQIPADRVYDRGLIGSDKPGLAEVTFLRDSGYFGSGCSHVVYVNNQKAFAIRQGEGISLKLAPGSYFFRLETGAGLCPNIATSQDAVLTEDSNIAYRILLPSDGSLRLTRIR